MKKLLLCLLFAVALTAHADFDIAHWEFKKNIELPSSALPSYVQLKIDKEISRVRNSFQDIRIVSKEGGEIPYQLVVKNEVASDDFYPTTILNTSSSQNGDTFFVIDLGKSGFLHNKINIVSDSENFKRYVSVSASDSLLPAGDARWSLLTSKGYIYDFTDKVAGFNEQSGVVNYPQNTSRYLFVKISGNGESAVHITGAQVYRYEVSVAEENVVSVESIVSQNIKEQTSEIIVDLGVQGFPTHSIKLSTGDSNFNRRVVIQSSEDSTHWRALSNGYIFRVATEKFTGENLELQYPESNDRYIRVIVFNLDDKPVSFSQAIEVRGVARTLIFKAETGQNYSLYYGNDEARPARYDLAKIFPYLEASSIPKATLGAQEFNTAFLPKVAPIAPFTERHKSLLTFTLVLLVGIIAGVIFSQVRNYKKDMNI